MRLLTTLLLATGLGSASCNPCQYGTAPDGTHHYFDCTAYWKARNVLTIKVDGSLKSGTTYTIGLGREGCALKSYVGAALPATEWSFTTANG